MKNLIKYLLEKTSKDVRLNEKLSDLFNKEVKSKSDIDDSKNVGLILSERLINMPIEIIPPLYKMLQEEIEDEIEDVSKITILI